MKYYALIALLFITYNLQADSSNLLIDSPTSLATYRGSWLVVGAGPAGITAVAALRDACISPENIIWVDEEFNVGALGKYYRPVLANSTRKMFFSYFTLSNQLKRFLECARHSLTPRLSDCTLQEIITPLAIASGNFRQEVACTRGRVTKLTYDKQTQLWTTQLPAITLEASNVILATGSHPKKLDHDGHVKQRIPLEIALNIKELNKESTARDKTIIVFGSAHSAALVLMNLVELNYTKIIHVYKKNFRFRRKNHRGERFPFSGLKGPVADWVQKNIIDHLHPYITQVPYGSTEIEDIMTYCNPTIIDAVGFEPNSIPVDIEDLYTIPKKWNEIGPHLYGLGIAFPVEITDSHGTKEDAIGILNFMETMKKYLPHWLKNT